MAATPENPTTSYVPTPLALLKDTTPAQYAAALALNVLTKRNNFNGPLMSKVELAWVQEVVGNRAGKVRGPLGPMRKDHLLRHLDGLESLGLLYDFKVETPKRAAEPLLVWRWLGENPQPHLDGGLRGRQDFVRVPKAIAWDRTLTGTEKAVYSALHWLLFISGAESWQETLQEGLGAMCSVTGLERRAVSSALRLLQIKGLLTLPPVRERELTKVELVPLTARYLLIDSRGRQTEWPRYLPMTDLPHWEDEHQRRVEHYRETHRDAAAEPTFWFVPVVSGRPAFDAVLWLDDDSAEEAVAFGGQSSGLPTSNIEEDGLPTEALAISPYSPTAEAESERAAPHTVPVSSHGSEETEPRRTLNHVRSRDATRRGERPNLLLPEKAEPSATEYVPAAEVKALLQESMRRHAAAAEPAERPPATTRYGGNSTWWNIEQEPVEEWTDD